MFLSFGLSASRLHQSRFYWGEDDLTAMILERFRIMLPGTGYEGRSHEITWMLTDGRWADGCVIWFSLDISNSGSGTHQA